MKTLLGWLSVAALLTPALLPVSTPASAPPPRGDVLALDDGSVLIDLSDGLAVSRLCEGLSEVLQRPVLYRQEHVAGVELHGSGRLVVPGDQVLDVVADLLDDIGLLLWEGAGSEVALRVTLLRNADRLGLSHQVVPFDQLLETPARRTGLYTTTVALEHLDARSTMAVFAPFFDTRIDGIRNVENSNALVMTSHSLVTLRRMAEMLDAVDVPASGFRGRIEDRVTALEQQVAGLQLASGR